ncbi:MAG: XRE family transcriptional regulator [Acidobacteria bacterium]|nr:XRE family transcriptional regulator [Acidobacteriota bacterium]
MSTPSRHCPDSLARFYGDFPKPNLSTLTAELTAREVLRCSCCTLVQFRTTTNNCRRCDKPLPLAIRYEAPPESTGGLIPFPSDRLALQPRGKTARELTIGRKLRDLREARHLTQQDMAAKAGVPRTYISRIENARLLPGPVMLLRIADALGVAILDLLPTGKNLLGTVAFEDEGYWTSITGLFAQLRPGDMAMVVAKARDMAEGISTPSMVPELMPMLMAK